ncbi:hypothetical protein ElyMa_007028600 [Elysia marginata]|uniref:Uncharacterized protein n=1 Tax=Elysia marginata TaxID=1093978 RepID=A0AAV4JRU9_9GAST|nr:hypothetical protein ElyMa_007028600 [Elysia marginata]
MDSGTPCKNAAYLCVGDVVGNGLSGNPCKSMPHNNLTWSLGSTQGGENQFTWGGKSGSSKVALTHPAAASLHLSVPVHCSSGQTDGDTGMNQHLYDGLHHHHHLQQRQPKHMQREPACEQNYHNSINPPGHKFFYATEPHLPQDRATGTSINGSVNHVRVTKSSTTVYQKDQSQAVLAEENMQLIRRQRCYDEQHSLSSPTSQHGSFTQQQQQQQYRQQQQFGQQQQSASSTTLSHSQGLQASASPGKVHFEYSRSCVIV